MSGMDRVFDWPALMRIGLKELRLSPAAFWALTPAEFLILVGQTAGSAPMARSRLAELASTYPDANTGTHEKEAGHG